MKLVIRHQISTVLGISVLTVLVQLSVAPAIAGVTYTDPSGGWRYKYDGNFVDLGNAYPPGYGNQNTTQALDGQWQHDQTDRWDGSGPGEIGPTPGGPAPGGLEPLTEGSTSYLRMQDPGNPEYHGWQQGVRPQNTNRRLNFGHKIESDGALPSELVLDNGITFSFRARIPNSGVLDSIYSAQETIDNPGAPAGTRTPTIQPWASHGGGGYPIHDEGRGMFYIVQNDPDFFNTDSAIAFSLMTSADVEHTALVSQNADLQTRTRGGLIMNNLAGSSPEPQIDTFDSSPNPLNLLEMDDEDLYGWNEFWITIDENGGAAGTHVVNVYMNGSTTPTTFNVTATADGNAEYLDDAWLAMGLSSSELYGAVDIDFYAYSLGVILPVGVPLIMPDLNMDGWVDIFDVGIVSEHWMETGAPGIPGDANKDGEVNIFDVGIISENWNPSGGGSVGESVPEPSSLVLCALGVMGLFVAHRARSRHA